MSGSGVKPASFRNRPRGSGSLALCPLVLFMIRIRTVLTAPQAPHRLIGLGLLAALIASASAQSVLAPVVVTASREPQPIDHVTADVVVIDATRIRDSSADSVEDLLRREAGLQVSRNGGPGHTAGVLIRGASAANSVVLIDGVRVGSGTLGQFDFSSLALAQIDHIEVLRGPASSLYGADAVGGVVQIFTRRGEGAPSVNAGIGVGGYASYSADAGISGALVGWDYAASVGREKSRGVSTLRPGDRFGNYNPDDDGYVRNTGQFKLGYAPAAGHRIGLSFVDSDVNSRYDDSQFLPPDFMQDASLDFHDRLQSRVATLDYRGVLSPVWTTTAQLARNDDDAHSGHDLPVRFRTLHDQFTWQNTFKPSAGQQVLVAYEHLNERATSDSFLAEEKRDNDAVVLGYTGEFGSHVVQADLRHDRNSVYGGNTTGRVGWSMEVASGLRLRALAGTTFRAPSFNDLFYVGYGLPTIQPEHGRSIEAGLNWRAGGSEAAATVYRNRVRNLIAYEPDASFCPPDPAYQFGCARNVGRARLQGATFTGAHRWDRLQLRGTIDVLDARDQQTHERLARRAAHQETLSADYDLGAWRIGADVLRLGARPDAGVQLAAYETLDLRASWRFAPRWRLEAKLLNATDRDIQPARDFQSLGRQAWLTVRYDGKGL